MEDQFNQGLDVETNPEDAWLTITENHVDHPNYLDLITDSDFPYAKPIDEWTKEDIEANKEALKLESVFVVDFPWAHNQWESFLCRMRVELASCRSTRKLNQLIDEMNSFDDGLAVYTHKEYFSNSYEALEKIINNTRLSLAPKVVEVPVVAIPAPAKVEVTRIKDFPRWMVHPTTGKKILCPDSQQAGKRKREGYVWLER